MTERKLTYAAAVALEPGQTLRCPTVRGLELRGRKGVKSWHLYYRAPDGQQRRPKLGEFPTLQIDAARTAARTLLERVAVGGDPSAAKEALRAAPTMADLWAAYWTRRALPRKKAISRAGDEQNWRKHIAPALADRRVADVAFQDVQSLLARIGRTAPVAANRVRALLSTMFLKVAAHPELKWRSRDDNPVYGTTAFREHRRKRHVTQGEFQGLGSALSELAAVYPRHVAALYVILLSGSRVTEMLSARWEQFDAGRGCLVLSEHKTDRSGVDRVIRLPEAATRLLSALPRTLGSYIFSSPAHATGHLDRFALTYVWQIVRAKAGAPDLRLQDLRRTFATAAKSRGVSVGEIGELFSHSTSYTTDRYAWLFEGRAREVAEGTGADLAQRLGLLPAPAKGLPYLRARKIRASGRRGA